MTYLKRNNTGFSGKIYLMLCCGFCITSIYGQQNKRVPDIQICCFPNKFLLAKSIPDFCKKTFN